MEHGIILLEDVGDEDDEAQLEEDPRFLQRIEASRQSLREGKGVRLEDVEE